MIASCTHTARAASSSVLRLLRTTSFPPCETVLHRIVQALRGRPPRVVPQRQPAATGAAGCTPWGANVAFRLPSIALPVPSYPYHPAQMPIPGLRGAAGSLVNERRRGFGDGGPAYRSRLDSNRHTARRGRVGSRNNERTTGATFHRPYMQGRE